MGQLAEARTLNDFWGFVDLRVSEFGATLVAASLNKLSVLAGNTGVVGAVAGTISTPNYSGTVATTAARSSDLKLEKHSSFVRLRDRFDELLATPHGRCTFLPY